MSRYPLQHPDHVDDAASRLSHLGMAENTPGLVPIPAPQPKTSYNAPIFQTFQDRRRAKDAARQGPLLPSVQVDHQYQPGPSALAMMARPSDPPPAPPSRPTVLPPAPPPRSPALPYPAQPSSPHAGPSRPLPRPLPTAASASPINPPPTIPPSHPSPSSLERSDTVSSVRSLDRFGFSSSRRPLPRAPVGVNSSKSLDRGIPSGDDPVRRGSRKQPSIVAEEDDQGSPASGASPMPEIVIPTIAFYPDPDPPGIPNIAIEPTPTIAVHDTRSPAKFSPLPSFNLPDSDSEESNTGDTSGVELAALPTIAVSSGHSHTSGPLPDGAIVCAGCEQPIIGRIVNAMGRRFHPACFKCDECGSLLEHVSSFEHDGKAYCHLDYHEKFAHHCYYCKTAIVEDRFITLNDETLGERYYHELHFFCSECGDPFLDPSKSSAPGTECSAHDDVGETNPFVIHKGHPYCERCHIRLHKPKCKACKKPIPDVAVDALGAKWHQDCFVCSNCSKPFANNRFFPNDGKPLCIVCYESTL